MAYQGNARLSMFRNGIEVNRLEKHNAITGWIGKAMSRGNFNFLMDRSKALPIKKWYEGCLLTDTTNNASSLMIASGANITAQAGNNAYSGTNQRRGSFNGTEAGEITGGYRFVWDWATNQGNGTIASIALTRHRMAVAEYYSNAVPENDGVAVERMNSGNAITIDYATLGQCSIIDYAKNRGYAIGYSSGTITVNEYELNSDQYHLLVPNLGARLIATHTISQTVQQYTFERASLSYTGDYIHLLTHTSNGNKLYDYAIKLSDWTCTETEHTYTNVSFLNQNSNYRALLRKDVMPIINGYVWAYSNSGQKIVKCSLSNDADVTAYDNPLYTAGGLTGEGINGASVLLPNGDWYKFVAYNESAGTIQSCLYCHNGNFYMAKHNNLSSRYQSDIAANANEQGTVLMLGSTSMGEAVVSLDTIFPYVSTVLNLDEAVVKTADLTMKLTYEITEVTT